ncbi:MAG TPA: NlpC/P60 family protein [Actinomycetota bacterium]|nr:NlpC/P60 family protein [Actinomycetota bacterium]
MRTTAGAIVATVAVCLSLAATPAQASTDVARQTSIRAGEAGSGMPEIPVVYPRTRTASAAGASRTAATSTTITFADLDGSDAWAKTAIVWVAKTNNWMLDFAPNPDGTFNFRPDAIETRKYFARSVVRAFAPDESPDPTIVFSDLDPSVGWYRYASVAVGHGWMTARDGAFAPDAPVTMAMVHRALALALGLRPAAEALNDIHTRDGVTFQTAPHFGTTVLGMRLGLRYNAPTGSESRDVAPFDRMPRAQVAYSLWKATTQPSWSVPDLLTQYAKVELPHLAPRALRIVRWGIRYAGYPYIWGGEWGLEKPEPSALGGQPRSGFDCSGLTWWLLRADDGGYWNINPPRPYHGWSLPQRTSADMATMAPTKVRYDDLMPGDLMFYDGDRNGIVDHVDTYIGRGWALDSSSTPGGVTIMWVGRGWYREHFRFGRRILPN